MITGTWWVSRRNLMRRQTSNPSRPGIMTSRRTTSTRSRAQMSSASWPLCAVSTSKYSADSRASSSFTLARMSSTTRTRAVIRHLLDAPRRSRFPDEPAHGVDEAHDRNRLRDVGLAAAAADALLIALHGIGGHGDDRDLAQVIVILEPLRHLEPGHLGKLDVHQDQLRPVLAGEAQ